MLFRFDHGPETCAEKRRSPEAAAAITKAIRDFFADAEVPESSYAHLIETMPGNDPDDHRHMAAAIAGHAHALVTWNRDDFPPAELALHGVEIIDPDSYRHRVLTRLPREVAEHAIGSQVCAALQPSNSGGCVGGGGGI